MIGENLSNPSESRTDISETLAWVQEVLKTGHIDEDTTFMQRLINDTGEQSSLSYLRRLGGIDMASYDRFLDSVKSTISERLQTGVDDLNSQYWGLPMYIRVIDTDKSSTRTLAGFIESDGNVLPLDTDGKPISHSQSVYYGDILLG